jgi:cobalt-zinc-cadmium efflux system protein
MGMGIFIGYEAILRLIAPERPEPGPMAIAAVIGLIGSGASAFVLRKEHEGFAARSAFLDVVGDAVGSIAALVAAALVVLVDLAIADAIASLAVTLLVVPRAIFLLRDAVSVLMESTPGHVSLLRVRERLLAIPGVGSVHDLHAWQITAGLPMATVHVVTQPGADYHAVLDAVDACLAADFDMAHSTVQVEPADHDLEADAHD